MSLRRKSKPAGRPDSLLEDIDACEAESICGEVVRRACERQMHLHQSKRLEAVRKACDIRCITFITVFSSYCMGVGN